MALKFSRLPESVVGLALVALLAIPFAAIGTALIYVAIHTLVVTVTMKSWPTVPATLQQVELQADGSSSQKVVAKYTYSFNGQPFEGHRVSLYGSDNLGTFQKKTYDELQSYLSRQAPYPVHVNPKAPGESILIPVVRLEASAFTLLFACIFGGMGWGLLLASCFGYKRLRTEAKLVAQYPNELWRQRVAWSAPRIKSSESSVAFSVAVVTIMWNLFCWPMTIPVPERLSAGEYSSLLLLIFPLLGIAQLYWAVVYILRARRFGKTYLVLDTMPARQGEHLSARVYASGALGEIASVDFVLSCLKHTGTDHSGSGFQSKTLWEKDLKAQILKGQSASGEVLLKIDFAIPADLPDSSLDRYEWITWELAGSAALKEGADFEAEFEVPVYKRAQAQPVAVHEK